MLRLLYQAMTEYRAEYGVCIAHITHSTDNSKELILVDKEELCDRVEGVMNLSKDYGQLGTLWVTNLRIAWAAALQDNYNCSVPFLQVSTVRVVVCDTTTTTGWHAGEFDLVGISQ